MKKFDERDILRAVNDMGIPVGALQLGERLGMASASAGRMLTALEEKGYLTKVSNKGRVITEKGRDYLNREDERDEKLSVAEKLITASAYYNNEQLLQILQTRLLLEGYTAECCAALATDEDIEKLKVIQLEYYYAILHGESGSEQDLKLHLKIAQIAGNKFIYDMLKLMLTSNNAYSSFSKVPMPLKKEYHNEHDSILEAIFDGRAEDANARMQEHIRHIIKVVGENS